MKKITFIIALISMSLSVFAQNKTTREILRSKKWELNSTHSGVTYHTTVVFTEDRMQETIVYNGKTETYNLLYRLSDNPDKNLPLLQRAVSNSGKYLISVANGALIIWEIVSASDSYVELRPYGTNTISKLVAKPL